MKAFLKYEFLPEKIRSILFFYILYVISIPFQKIVWLPLIENKIQISEFIYIILLSSFFLTQKLRDFKRVYFNFNLIDISVTLWLFVVFINSVINPGYASFIEMIGQIYLTSFYFLTRVLLLDLTKSQIIDLLILIFKITGLIISLTFLVGIILIYFGIDIGVFWFFNEYPYFGSIYRFKAFTNEPVMLASILSIVFWVVTYSLARQGFKNNKIVAVLFLITCLMLFLTFAKSLAIIASLVCFLLASKFMLFRKYKFFLFMFGFCFLGFYLFMSHFILTSEKHRTEKRYGKTTFDYKIKSWYIYKTCYLTQKENALELFKEHPFFGIGGGNMVNAMKERNNDHNKNLYDFPAYDPLSGFTGVLAEFGLFGFISFILLLTSIILSLNFLPKNDLISYMFTGSLSYFILEGICTDIMNFRHFWVILSFFSAYTIYNGKMLAVKPTLFFEYLRSLK